MQHFGGEHDGAWVSLTVGERFSLVLPENPTTGFRWDTERAYDGVLEGVRDTYRPHAAPERLGSGGTREWLYEAAAPGRCTLTLHLRRPWQRQREPAAVGTYSLVVTVSEKGERA